MTERDREKERRREWHESNFPQKFHLLTYTLEVHFKTTGLKWEFLSPTIKKIRIQITFFIEKFMDSTLQMTLKRGRKKEMLMKKFLLG